MYCIYGIYGIYGIKSIAHEVMHNPPCDYREEGLFVLFMDNIFYAQHLCIKYPACPTCIIRRSLPGM